MIQSIDQLGQPITLPSLPQRIISLVPSQTELLADLGLGDRVVGITKFCVHPAEWRASKPLVGGTKQLHLERIIALKPDLIIANKEENDREQIEGLIERYPVWISDVKTLDDAFEMISAIGDLTGTADEAHKLRIVSAKQFDLLRSQQTVQKTAIYLIWQKPFMGVGGDTFIDAMMKEAGFLNLLADRERYPELSLDEMVALQPDAVLLSSEPFPFKEKHIPAFKTALPHADILLVDGEMFSWYGSRLKVAPDYFKMLL